MFNVFKKYKVGQEVYLVFGSKSEPKRCEVVEDLGNKCLLDVFYTDFKNERECKFRGTFYKKHIKAKLKKK